MIRDILTNSFQLTEDQIKQTFQLFDKDNDGEITVKEIGAVLRKLKQNPTDSEVESMVRELDHDGNGVITLDEFKQAISKKAEVLTKDEIWNAFKWVFVKSTVVDNTKQNFR